MEMSDPVRMPWSELLYPALPGQAAIELSGWLVTRRGEPLLWLPNRTELARVVLSLYPAQTFRARCARALLARTVGRFRLPGLRRWELRFRADAPFVQVLRASADPHRIRPFGLYCGNPNAAGRRLLFLCFSPDGRPEQVIKAGSGPAAARRLLAEVNVLQTIGADRLHAPPVVSVWEGTHAMAMVQPWVPGQAPRGLPAERLGALFDSWLDRRQRVRLAELPPWQRCRARLAQAGFSCPWMEELGRLEVHPTVFHGDFAPWNLRHDPATNQWWVLDWERGELLGPPGWDWAYGLVQTWVLVHRWKPSRILDALAASVDSPPLRDYLAAVRAESVRLPLVAAGLLFHYLEWPPTEGRPVWEEVVRGLLARVRAQFRSGKT